MALTRVRLQSTLSVASQILREVGPANQGSYISSILLLKRLSDRFDEEAADAVERGVPCEVALTACDEHEFFLPASARWPMLTEVPTGKLGEALDDASHAIEEANAPRLDGVLSGTEWNDESRLGGTEDRERIIRDLLNHFGRVDLRDGNLAGNEGRPANLLGEVVDEFMTSRFPEDSGRTDGESYTPRTVARLIVELLQPAQGMRICDPTAGSGGMLISAAEYVQEQGGDSRNLVLHGQELHLGILSAARLRLALHGLYSARLEEGDVIVNPRLVDDSGHLICYDRVIGHPPFGLSDWGREAAADDPHNRFNRYDSIPHRSRGEFAFLLHMLKVTSPKGMVGAVMPQSILVRSSGADRIIRRGLLEDDLLEAVIGLAPNILYNANIPAVICILNRVKPAERQGKVLFIDAAQEPKEGKARNVLDREHREKVVDAYRAFEDVELFANVADLEKIERNDFSLAINQYVRTTKPAEPRSIQELIEDLREAEQRRAEAESKMDEVLSEFGNV